MPMKYTKYIFVFILAITLQSCFVAKKYQRPDDVMTDRQYRNAVLSGDSIHISQVSWREIFTDSMLTQYISRGLANNLDVRIALTNIEAAQAYVKQGQAVYYPTFNLGGSYALSSPSLNGQNLSERIYANQFELSGDLSWEADIWGKIRSNEKAVRATYMQTVAAQHAIKSRLVASIASNYYQLLALDQQKRIAEETIDNRRKSIETIQALKTAGSVTEVAIKQNEAQWLNARALLVDIDNNIHLLENAFCILLGDTPHDIPRTLLQSQNADTLLSAGVPIQLLTDRPDVLAAEYGLINAFELTNVARSNFYPSLRITAGGGFQSLDFDKFLSPASLFATLVGSVAQPVFNGRKIRTQLEVSKARQEAAMLDYKATIIQASREVSDALYTYASAGDKIELKRQEYQSYQQAISYSEELLNYGLANYLEVLTARESMLSAQLSLVNTQYSRLNSMVQLYRAIGGGWQ